MCHFQLTDLVSPDTGKVLVDPRLVDNIDSLAKEVLYNFNCPLIITSGYRTPKHNKKVGGAPNSYHMKGMAIDCYCSSCSHEELGTTALLCGFTTAIIYKTHVHLDIREKGLGLRKS